MVDDAQNERRQNWRIHWLFCINQLSDLELQRRMWLDKTSSSPHWSFIEFYEEYISDCVLDGNGAEIEPGYAWALEENFVTAKEAAVVEEFDVLLRSYKPPQGDRYEHEAILNDPAWHAVVEAAARAKTQLAGMLHDSRELRSLLDPAG